MGVRLRSLVGVMVVCALAGALPARALASGGEESILMDDQELIYSSPSRIAWTLQQAKDLGINRIKVSVVWSLVAPHANSRQKPRFDATDPAAYPPGAWLRYDRLVQWAQSYGLKVYFQLTPPSPKWAVAAGKATQGYPWSFKPNAAAYGQFVQAVAKRYSGSYVPAPGQAPLPRVSYWGIWNEPNEGAWLNPQWRTVGSGRGSRRDLTAPAMYRGLIDAAYKGLAATGHAHDTILIGETASHGWIYPIPFFQALYCTGGNDQPLKGAAATANGCPASGSRGAFVAAHPGLFKTEFAHHPYSFDTPPDARSSDHNLITLQNLSVLDRSLARILGAYGQGKGDGIPMYLTEWGYKTNPPNPYVHTSPAQQALWLNQGEYMTWRMPSVRGLAQFLLVDDRPKTKYPKGSRLYWGTFQTGLLFEDLRAKPSYDAFRLPIWLPTAHHGGNVAVWGQIRPVVNFDNPKATLQFQRRGSRNWSTVRDVTTSSPLGYLFVHVPIPGPGQVRLAWNDPQTNSIVYSRSASVS